MVFHSAPLNPSQYAQITPDASKTKEDSTTFTLGPCQYSVLEYKTLLDYYSSFLLLNPSAPSRCTRASLYKLPLHSSFAPHAMAKLGFFPLFTTSLPHDTNHYFLRFREADDFTRSSNCFLRQLSAVNAEGSRHGLRT